MPDPLPDSSGKGSTPVPDAKPISGDTINPSSDSVGGTRTEGADYSAEAVKRLDIPSQLGGYRILSILGEGGMGRVYLAEDARLNRKVALKVMRADLAAKPEAVERFLREARAVAAIEHDHVIGIFQVGEDNGVPFLAMPLLKGETLDARLKRDKVVPVPEAVRLAHETADGLATAHEAGLIHRDIKPANLWLELKTPGAARIKILDFGLAHTGGAHLTASGTVMGTPAFMAPEQARGHKVDHRCDLFSLGAVIYQMLTGKRPFTGEDAMAIVTSLALDTPTEPHRLNGAVPPALSHLVMRLIAKAPAQRPQSARGVAAELLEIEREFTAPPVAMAVPVVMPPLSQPEANPWSDIDDIGTLQADPLPTTPFHESRPPEDSARAQRKPGSMAVLLAVLGIAVLGGAIYLFTKSRERPVPTQPEVVEKVDPPKGKDDPEKARIAEAEAALPALEAKFKEAGVTFESFAKDVQLFKAKWGGTPASIRAAEMLMKLPSSLDKLDPAKIPEDAKAAWKASGFDGKDLVAVLGEHRQRHWAQVNSVAVDPNGKLIASCGLDGVIRLWDSATLKPAGVLGDRSTHPGGAVSLAFSKDGKELLSAGWSAHSDIFARHWDLGKLSQRQAYEIGSFASVSFSRDGKPMAVTVADTQWALWELGVKPAKRSFEGTKDSSNWAILSPDGRRFAAGGGKSVRVWDAGTGETICAFPVVDSVIALTFTPDGDRLVSGSENRGVHVFDIKNKKQLHHFPDAGQLAYDVCASPDGTKAASASADGTVRIWDIVNGKQIAVGKGHVGPVGTVAFLPNGKQVVSGGGSKHSIGDGTIRLWDAETGKEVQPLTGHSGPVHSVAIAPNCGTILTASNDKSLRSWSFDPQPVARVLQKVDSNLHCAAISPDSAQALAGRHDMVQLWDLVKGEEIREIMARDQPAYIYRAIVYSADGKRAWSGQDGKLRLWDLENGRELNSFPVQGGIASLALSPDGRRLATGGDGVVRVWDLTITPPRKLAEAVNEYGPGAFNVHRLAWSPNGSEIAVAAGDAAVYRYALTPKGLAKLPALAGRNAGGMLALAYDPTGTTLVAVDGANGAALWDIKSAKRLREWQLPGYAADIAFAADGRHLATANGNGTVYILRLPPNMEVSRSETDVPQFERTDPDNKAALDFDGKSAYVEVPNVGSGDGELTLEAWVWARRTAHTGGILAAYGKPCISLAQHHNPGGGCDNSWIAHRFASVGGQAGHITFMNNSVQPKKWTHVAAVWNKKQMTLYIDGKAASWHNPPHGDIEEGPQRLLVGRFVNAKAGWSFDGVIDEIRVSKTARYAVDFRADRRFKPDADTVCLFHCDEGQGDKLIDSSGNDNHGKLVGASWVTAGPLAISPEQAKQQQEAAAKELGVKVQIENSIGMKLNLIPAGSFLMGSPEGEKGRLENEGPRHEVHIGKPFQMSALPVTVGQFRSFVRANNYKTLAESNGKGAGRYLGTIQDGNLGLPVADLKCNWNSPGFEQADAHPVVCVGWEDAMSFCAWLSKKEGRTYRLPTEAEWEYACRAGSQSTHFFGDSNASLDEYAWWGKKGNARTHPAGQLRPNAWGLFDVYGNAFSWCLDDLRTFEKASATDPRGPNPTMTHTAAIRGGSFHELEGKESYFRSAYRHAPFATDWAITNLGFRVVCEVQPVKAKDAK